MKIFGNNFRWALAGLFFIIGLVAYMDRANIAVVGKFMMEDLAIDKTQFGLLSTIFSLGYALSQLPSGMLIQRYGNKIMLIAALVVWSAFTILTPLMASFVALCVVRFIFGMGEAPMYPANAAFNNHWFGRREKGRAASFLLAGSYFGPVIAPIVSIPIVAYYGWHSVFYIFGAVGLVLAVIYYFVAAEKPEQSRLISAPELAHIQKERFVSTGSKVPWKNYLNNKEFWAIGLAYGFIGFIPGLFMTWLPIFLLESKGLNFKEMGFWAALPWLLICLFVFGGGALSDAFVKRFKSFQIGRTYVAIFGLIAFDVFMFGGMLISSTELSIICLSLAFGFFGLPVCVSWAVAADKGRDKSAVVSSWMNLWGNIGSAVSPLIVGVIAHHYSWNYAIGFSLVPVSLAALAYLFVKPDNALE